MLAANINTPGTTKHQSSQKNYYGHLPVRNASANAAEISFEFFPPSSDAAEEKLWQTIQQLKTLNPSMVSVTYGADGSSRDNTYSIVKRILDETSLVVAPHMTCVGASKGELRELAQQYWRDGVRHIVALRGDKPKDSSLHAAKNQYQYCSEFVADLSKIADFDITVGAYPETHPEALSAKDDLENLQRKFDAGASRAITQFFFVTDHYLRFRDHCSLFGIEGEIIPGILPVSNFKQVERFADMCGTEVPAWLKERFAGLEDDPKTRKLVAAAVAIDQVNELRQNGVSKFHMYTLNQADLTYAVSHTLGVRPAQTLTPGEAA